MLAQARFLDPRGALPTKPEGAQQSGVDQAA